MRKFLKFILSLTLIIILCGCQNSVIFFDMYNFNNHPKIKIGMSIPSEGTFLNSVCQSAKKAADEHDVQLEILSANNNQKTQSEQVKEWAENNYAAVIIVLCDDTAAKQILDNAGTMPIVFINRCPSDHDVLQSKQNVIYIGGKEGDAGRLQGEFLSEYFISQNKTTPTIAVISGENNDFTSNIRIEAAKEAMSNAGLMPFYVYESSGGWDKSKTQSGFYKFLQDKPNIDAVLAANDDMAIGAADALAQSGYALSEIPIVGVDATPQGRAAVRDGRIDFTVYQDPEYQGAGAVNEIMNMLGGYMPNVDIDSIQWHDYIPVTAANVDQLFPDDR